MQAILNNSRNFLSFLASDRHVGLWGSQVALGCLPLLFFSLISFATPSGCAEKNPQKSENGEKRNTKSFKIMKMQLVGMVIQG